MRQPLQRFDADIEALMAQRRELQLKLDAVLQPPPGMAEASSGARHSPQADHQVPSGQGQQASGDAAADLVASNAPLVAEELLRALRANLVGGDYAHVACAHLPPACSAACLLVCQLAEAGEPSSRSGGRGRKLMLQLRLLPQVAEDSLWSTLSWTLRLMLDRRQMAACLEHSW